MRRADPNYDTLAEREMDLGTKLDRLVDGYMERPAPFPHPFGPTTNQGFDGHLMDHRACSADTEARPSGTPDEYNAIDDFAKSIDECYRAIRERMAKGGPPWSQKEYKP